MRVLVARLILPSLIVLSCTARPASGHELETTHVLVSFTPDGRYLLDVLNDPGWLWLRLAPTPRTPPAHEERDRELTRWTDRFREEVTVMFDGRRVPIEHVEYVPPLTNDPAPIGGHEPGLMRLTGAVPAGAKTFQFAYALAVDRYPLTIQLETEKSVTFWTTPSELSGALVFADLRPMHRWDIARQYFDLGFTHIVPKGLDHILFVIGLFLLGTTLRALLVQVSAFTAAHTITLGLSIYGVFSLSSAIVEPLIALSIAYVAIENVVTRELKRSRVALVFAFGLLHGMGFAGVLADLGLPRAEFLTALLSFNVGVEGGQLAVIAIAFVSVVAFRGKDWYRRRAVVPLSLLIAVIGLYWTVQRVLSTVLDRDVPQVVSQAHDPGELAAGCIGFSDQCRVRVSWRTERSSHEALVYLSDPVPSVAGSGHHRHDVSV